jgi:hypothetical protein
MRPEGQKRLATEWTRVAQWVDWNPNEVFLAVVILDSLEWSIDVKPRFADTTKLFEKDRDSHLSR